MGLLGLVPAFAGLALVIADRAGAQVLPTDESAFRIGKRFPLIGYPTTLATADLDDDGLPDLIVAESYPNRIAIWWNDGYGGLEPTPTVIADLAAFAAVAIDANGDRLPDVVWTDSLGLHRALVRPGRQVGAPELIVAAPDLGPLAVGDLDRNGRDDLVLAEGTNVSWMRSGPAGLMAPAVLESTGTIVTTLAVGGGSPDDVREIAVTPQGRHGPPRREVEIAVAHEWVYDEPPPAIDVLRIDQHGAVSGTTEVPPPQDFGPVWSLVLADLDGDGKTDLILGGGNGAVALWGDGFGQSWAFGVGPGEWPTDSYNLAVADVDGDGWLDVVTQTQYGRELYGDGALCVFTGTGSRRFTSGTQYIPDPDERGLETYNECQGLALTDMNGDGEPDIVMVERLDYYSSSSRILIALSGPGNEIGLERIDRLSDAPYLPYAGLHVTQSPGMRQSQLMVELGSGTEFVRFGDGGRLIDEPGPDVRGPLLFADVDGDGRDDAIEIRDSISIVHVASRLGAYARAETVAVPGLRCVAHLEPGRGMALVGVDSLGRIAIARRRQDGRYDYQTLPSSLLTFDNETDDLRRRLSATALPRGRGRSDDLVVATQTSTPTIGGPSPRQVELLLLRRDPQGVWQEIQHLSGPSSWNVDSSVLDPFVVADMNVDGRPDVLFLESFSEMQGYVYVFLSNDDGTLGQAQPQTVGLSEYPMSFLVADLDRDGRPDVVIPAARESNTPWLAVYFGDGRGRFDRDAFFYLGTIYSAGAFAGAVDLDGDGIADIAAMSSASDGTFLTTLFGAGPKPAVHRRRPPRVELAAAPTPLAIAGISPMPARDAFDVRFTAPSPELAHLELLDVTGRRVRERTVDGAGPAHFAVGNDVHSGVYWLRLTQGAQSATARVVVLR